MIQPQELRIGNWVAFGSQHTQVTGIEPYCGDDSTITGCHVCFGKNNRPEGWADISQLSPIPLSEEILLKCGFEKITAFDVHGVPVWYSHYDNCFQIRLCYIGRGVEKIITIKYVHELQNAIKIITGRELDIKL